MDTHKQDVATLIELLKMAAERWPRAETDQVSQRDLLREDHSLLEMWPEACRRTGNLRAVQLLLGHTKIESTVRYLGIDVDDALAIAEQVDV